MSQEDRELAVENERLRRESRILREERDILKKATADIPHWVGKAPWLSNARWPKRALGPAQIRDKTSPARAFAHRWTANPS